MRGVKAKTLRKLAVVEVGVLHGEVKRAPVRGRQAFTSDTRYLYQELKGRRAYSKRKP